MVKPQETALLLCLLLGAVATAAGRAQAVSTEAPAAAATNATKVSPEGSPAAGAEGDITRAADVAAEDPDNVTVAEEEELQGAVQYPFRDLPADVLRDFPGLCFGSTALRLFQVGQSWSLTPFCGVATCLVSRDGFHLMERVQDCGPQPLRNPRCKNVNVETDQPFPHCCPVFECEDGVDLEYPTQEELQKLAHEAAQAAVRAQYDEDVVGGAQQTARVAAATETAEEPAPVEEATTDVVPPEAVDAVEEESPKADV